MDPSRTLLLGLLIAALAGCASWPATGTSPDALPLDGDVDPPARVDEPRCDTAPTMSAIGSAFVVLDACQPAVALFRRDAVSDSPPVFLGVCHVPCVDQMAELNGVYAYSTAALAVDASGIVAGPDSPETYLTADPRTPPPR